MIRFFIFLPLDLWTYLSVIHVSMCLHADLPGLRASKGPQVTIPSNLLITSYKPDIVVYNSEASSVALLELACPLDSEHHIEAAIDLGSKIRQSTCRI